MAFELGSQADVFILLGFEHRFVHELILRLRGRDYSYTEVALAPNRDIRASHLGLYFATTGGCTTLLRLLIDS